MLGLAQTTGCFAKADLVQSEAVVRELRPNDSEGQTGDGIGLFASSNRRKLHAKAAGNAWNTLGSVKPNTGMLMALPSAETRREWARLVERGVPPGEWNIDSDIGPPRRFSDDARRPAIVFSFMRSGTHFLMNTLARNFGYIADPWLALENAPINFFYAPSVDRLFELIARRRYRNLAKSHHTSEFFGDALAKSRGTVDLFYIYRHPAHCLKSYRTFLPTWPGAGGTACDSLLKFMGSKPAPYHSPLVWTGSATMLDYWVDHVRGWLTLAKTTKAIHVVRYEDLKCRFDAEVRRMGDLLDLDCIDPVMPDRDAYITVGPIKSSVRDTPDWLETANAYIEHKYPGFLESLGYSKGVDRAVQDCGHAHI